MKSEYLRFRTLSQAPSQLYNKAAMPSSNSIAGRPFDSQLMVTCHVPY